MKQPLPIHVYLGGSFDPVHKSHVALLTHVYQTLSIDANDSSDLASTAITPEIFGYFLPTSRSPLKSNSTDPQHRLNMLHLVCEDLKKHTQSATAQNSLTSGKPQYQVCEHEIWQNPPTYTIDTLTELRKQNPNTSIIFILGADSIASLDKWKSGDQLIDFAHLWVMPRDNLQSIEEIKQTLSNTLKNRVTTDIKDLKTQPKGSIYIDSHSVLPLSSSQIRLAMADNDLKTVKSALPAEVYSYIMKNNLYH